MTKVLGVIPARLESQRLPRKVLRPICGRPMIAWVYERARLARCLDLLLVATDSEEVHSFCKQSNIPSMMTSKEHRSGTDRIVEVVNREPAEVCVNIQGDEPTVTPDHVELLVKPFRDEQGTQVSTLKVAIEFDEARDPNNVKVVTDAKGRALYFSRALIPYDRSQGAGAGGRARFYKHLGLYAYTAEALRTFSLLPPSPLEELEKLEQLRFLENGIPIKVLEAREDTIGVDTEADLKKVEEFIRRTNVGGPRA